MWERAAKAIAKGYAVLWMAAVGGIVGANLAGIIGMVFFVAENKSVYVTPWVHGGWYVGTILFFLGGVTRKLRLINNASPQIQSRLRPKRASGEEDGSPARLSNSDRDSSTAKTILGFGLAGGIMGLLFGLSSLVFFFSLAYSPFAPKSFVSSVKVVQEKSNGTPGQRNVIKSNHPVALYLVLAPCVLGTAGGAVAGGVISRMYPETNAS